MKNLASLAFVLFLLGCPPPAVPDAPKLSPQQAASVAQVQSGVAVAVVLDSSGSMQGEKLRTVKTILKTSIKDKLSYYDVMGEGQLHLALIKCGGQATTILRMSPYEERLYLGAINSLVSGGGTPLGASMERAYAALRESGCEDKHIFVLSDGQSGDQLHLQNLSDVKVHVIGFQSDASYYDTFKTVGGEVIMADDAASLDNTTNSIFKTILKLEED